MKELNSFKGGRPKEEILSNCKTFLTKGLRLALLVPAAVLWASFPAAAQIEDGKEGSAVGSERGITQEHVVMFWNLENFYDYIDEGTTESDAEFSSWGERHWTKARFQAKCDAIAKMILWVGDKYG
ncbi:MAG: hypothetical protein LUD72_01370, partial [Bacteroidales bacterium]|nr:hypothetical protein [Bacteroidales bacterium]